MQVNGTNETRTRTSRAKNSNIVDRRMYFAIAVSPQAHDSETGGSVTSFTRAFNKTLSNITQSFWSHKNLDDITADSKGENVFTYNITLEPLVIELPENGAFSSNFLERLCVQLEGRHVAAMLIVGSSPAAFTVALVASSSSVPILWARGYSNFMTTLTHRDMHPYEIYLEPSAYETLQALRSLFLQTHWHSFTILADDSTTSTILLRRELSSILSTPPLNPTISYLPRNANTHAIFRRLADISRATRGVVILMSDLLQARRVLDEAKRLNMVDGHFVWLWLDTGGSTNNINPPITEHSNINPHIISSASSSSAAASSSSIINNDFSSKNTDDTNYSQEQDGRASLTINSNSEKNRLKRDLIKNVHKLNNKSNLINFSDIINNLQSDIGNVPQIQTNLNNINKSSTESSLPSPPQQITKNLNNRVPNKMYYHTEDMWPTIKTQRSRDKRQTIMTSYGMTQNNENYLLKNDKFLLFNNFNNLETNKKKNRVIFTSSKNNKYKHSGSSGSGGINDDDDDLFNDDEFKNDLPVGLLAIKVQPLKLDRHLIKGAVRLLAITLRNVLAKCPPEWIVTRTVQVKEWYASCWHNFPFSNNADFNKFNSDGSAGVKSAGRSDDGVNSGDSSIMTLDSYPTSLTLDNNSPQS
ncbi:uncharacterized protein LOC123290427 [Chrysoperla carnea]|uniref:uncharacterized protein LOC123290427 n=1 Tax=Chrysoperla carnea TaxID=189513 RepID=UPI001D063DE1|nr:uncharacterized protein LOC123290427 [Chrysoperla carnea]